VERYAGNQAALRRLSRTPTVIQRKCACGGSTPDGGPCPACEEHEVRTKKLTISRPGDRFEIEADRAAELVMQTPNPLDAQAVLVPVRQRVGATNQAVSRQTDDQGAGSAEPQVSSLDDDEDDAEPDETGMPKQAGLASAGPSVVPVQIPREAGQALDGTVSRFMGERYGHDFSEVRVHTTAAAVDSSRRLQAQAFTVGQHIYFNNGQYAPGTIDGQKLIAHELAHVIQQTSQPGGPSSLHRQVDDQPSAEASPAISTAKTPKKKAAQNVCSSGGCPQGKQTKVVRNDCAEGGPVDTNNFISALDVSLTGQAVTVTWSGGKTETWPCSPRPGVTPKGSDVVGVKCGINHTNQKKDGMAWFTGFKSQALAIGFHDSQKVGTGIVSHGCVRVCCDKAETINENTWSGKTTINVS